MMEEIKFHLVLCGSFFPMHDGHLNLLEASRKYILSRPEFTNINVSVDKVNILPTHPKSLARKHKLKNIDYWQHHRNRQMAEFVDKRKVFRDIETIIIRNDEEILPMAKIISNLKSKCDLMTSNDVIHKLIQISGVDSRVQSIIRSCQKVDISNSHKNTWLDRFPTLHNWNLVLVIDGRGVPDENREAVDKFKYVTRLADCPTFSSIDYLPRSSTIQRIIQHNIYYENEDIDHIYEKFRTKWLLDTGINLGKGREGIVRLMMLGGYEFVAVKITRLSKELYPKARFHEESTIWKHLAKISPNVIPRLFSTEIIKTKENDEYGIIVTEVGIALDKMYPSLKVNLEAASNSRKKIAVDESHFKTFFEHVNSISCYIGSCYLPFLPNSITWLESASKSDIETVKLQAFKSLKDCVLPGLSEADVIHKDLKVENMLYLPSSRKVVICDFGVSVLRSVKMDFGPRGAMKYYPILAMDNAKLYEPWCDAYFASLSLFEIFTEKKIFPDLNPSKVKDLRLAGVCPHVDNDVREKYLDGILWIEKQWNEEKEKRWSIGQ